MAGRWLYALCASASAVLISSPPENELKHHPASFVLRLYQRKGGVSCSVLTLGPLPDMEDKETVLLSQVLEGLLNGLMLPISDTETAGAWLVEETPPP